MMRDDWAQAHRGPEQTGMDVMIIELGEINISGGPLTGIENISGVLALPSFPRPTYPRLHPLSTSAFCRSPTSAASPRLVTLISAKLELGPLLLCSSLSSQRQSRQPFTLSWFPQLSACPLFLCLHSLTFTTAHAGAHTP